MDFLFELRNLKGNTAYDRTHLSTHRLVEQLEVCGIRAVAMETVAIRGVTKEEQFPGRRVTMGGGPKSPNNVTNTFFNTVCFRKSLGANTGAQNWLLAPDVI